MITKMFERLGKNIDRSFPMFKYLVLQTETHAFCGSLAFFALLAFYPFSVLLLSLTKYGGRWDSAYAVILYALWAYYPTAQECLVRNLEVSVGQYGRQVQFHSAVWVLLGAAGFFIPLESAFNRLWKFPQDRAYWKNQAVGLLLTTACCGLAVLFVLLTTLFHSAISRMVAWEMGSSVLRYLALKVSAILFSLASIFLFYKVLPNGKVRTRDALPAAVLAGVLAEVVRWLYMLLLPFLQIQKAQGPYYVSISFALLAYFQAFVLLGGAFVATGTRKHPRLVLLGISGIKTQE